MRQIKETVSGKAWRSGFLSGRWDACVDLGEGPDNSQGMQSDKHQDTKLYGALQVRRNMARFGTKRVM